MTSIILYFFMFPTKKEYIPTNLWVLLLSILQICLTVIVGWHILAEQI